MLRSVILSIFCFVFAVRSFAMVVEILKTWDNLNWQDPDYWDYQQDYQRTNPCGKPSKSEKIAGLVFFIFGAIGSIIAGILVLTGVFQI